MLLLAAVLLESERIWLNSLLSLALTPGCSYILLYCATLSSQDAFTRWKKGALQPEHSP